MRLIRYLAALLMILTGVLHVLSVFKVQQDAHALPLLAFGIVYFTIGILLMLNMKISAALGIIFPLLGIGTGFFVIGLQNWTTMLGILFAIDAIVVLCCIVLFIKKTK